MLEVLPVTCVIYSEACKNIKTKLWILEKFETVLQHYTQAGLFTLTLN